MQICMYGVVMCNNYVIITGAFIITIQLFSDEMIKKLIPATSAGIFAPHISSV